jgi:hypothetical protein
MKMNKTALEFLAMAGLGISLLATGIFFVARGDSSSYQDKVKVADYNEQATVIREGEMTAKQKEHRRLYRDYGSGKKLSSLQPTGNSNIIEVRSSTGAPLMAGTDEDMAAPVGINPIIFNIAQEADAIIIGRVNSKQSQVTENEDFVFTDHEVQVDEVLLNEANSHIQENGIVTISKPGGTVEFNGKIFRAIDVEFKPLEIGERYLLFLRFIPTTASYQAYRTGTFLLKEDKVFKVTRTRAMKRATNNLQEEKEINAGAFLSDVRAAISVKPKSKRKMQGYLY